MWDIGRNEFPRLVAAKQIDLMYKLNLYIMRVDLVDLYSSQLADKNLEMSGREVA